MISKKMENMVANSSAIRAMFEEGNRLAKIYGPENVFDFSLGNPNVPAPKAVKQAILDILDEEDELIIVADIMGGSVANVFSSYIQSEKVHIITGLNLPLLISLAQDLNSDVSTDELIKNAIQMGREGIVDLNKMIEENSDIEEDL